MDLENEISGIKAKPLAELTQIKRIREKRLRKELVYMDARAYNGETNNRTDIAESFNGLQIVESHNQIYSERRRHIKVFSILR